MRTIKFRIWDKTRKEWCKDMLIDQDGKINQYDYDYSEVIFTHGNRVKNLVVMQYTGIKDKNGKEICEGDIVKYEDGTSTFIEKVIFLDGAFYPVSEETFLNNLEGFAVIGNTYENPELLI